MSLSVFKGYQKPKIFEGGGGYTPASAAAAGGGGTVSIEVDKGGGDADQIYEPPHSESDLILPKDMEQKSKYDWTEEKMEAYILNVFKTDPNASLLPVPRFMVEKYPEIFEPNRPPTAVREDFKRIDYINDLLEAKTVEEKRAIMARRRKEIEAQKLVAQNMESGIKTLPVNKRIESSASNKLCRDDFDGGMIISL